jgi:hypothetical protein
MHTTLRRAGALAMAAIIALSIGFAGVASADNDDNRRKSSSDIELERSQAEDRETAGQVLEINTLKNPPELVLAVIEGRQLVRMLKTDEIAINAVRLGDHISVVGEKISEIEFEGNYIRVDEHYRANQKDKDKK